MQNNTATTEQRANTAFSNIMDSAPMGLLVTAALGLLLAGVFQFLFYFTVLPERWNSILLISLSAGLAAFFEGLGFYFLVTTVRDFSAGARREGWIGILATLLLWAYAIVEAQHIAAAFDRDTLESYWAILSIIGTIVCIVRIVEVRITLTVTSAAKRAKEERTLLQQLAEQQQLLDAVSGKLAIYEKEKERAELAELALQQQETEQRAEEERRRIADMERENQRLRRQLESAPQGRKLSSGTSREAMEAAARKFYKTSGILPTQGQVAQMLGLRDGKSVRLQFPNGSWIALMQSITSNLQQQAETISADNN
jgi:hypothetical protein